MQGMRVKNHKQQFQSNNNSAAKPQPAANYNNYQPPTSNGWQQPKSNPNHSWPNKPAVVNDYTPASVTNIAEAKGKTKKASGTKKSRPKK